MSEVENARGAMDGAVFANNVVSDEFLEKFRNEVGNVSQVGFAALAYEFFKILSDMATLKEHR